MFSITDQTGNTVALPAWPPKRIVSLVPSQTELLHYLGLEDEVVGITKFCVHPQTWFKHKQRVGGTKEVNIEKIKALKPDLIIANKEENVKEQVMALKAIAPVWVSDVNNLDDALAMISQVGELVGKKEKANQLFEQIKASFKTLNLVSGFTNKLTNHLTIPVTYLIWREPYMTIGRDTFIHDMLQRCGLTNVFASQLRYPQVTLQQIAQSGCRYVLLSSEPYPFKPKHAKELQQHLPGVKIIFVDGEMFSWYGSRLLLAAQYFKELRENILSNSLHLP